MSKHPKIRKPSLWQWLSELHWGIKTALPVFLLIGAMGSAAATWDKFGWWKPASVRYVDDKVTPIDRRTLDLQVEVAEGKRDMTRENIFKWTDKMEETSDPQRKSDYRGRVRELEIIERKQTEQINTLNRLRGRE